MLIGLDWVLPMMFLISHVTCSCIFHAYVLFFSLNLCLLFVLPLSPLFTIMGAICAGSVWRSEAQLLLKQLRVETTNPTASAIPPFSLAPSTSTTGGVTLEAIIAQLQQMEADFGGRLDYLINEMC